MTTVPISGRIISLEVAEGPSYLVTPMTLVPVSGHVEYPYNAPFIVVPSGEAITAIMFDDSALYGLGLGGNNFQPSSVFNIGDVIEIYKQPGTVNGGGVVLLDEDGSQISVSAITKARKVQNVSGGPNWVLI